MGKKQVTEALHVDYRPGINRLIIDFPSEYAANNDKVRSQYIEGAILPMWMEIAIEVFDQYYTMKRRDHDC